MTLHINEADQLVADYLKSGGTKYNVIYTGDRSLDKEWPCDSWLIQFNGVGFEYKTGIGHRISHEKNKHRLNLKVQSQIKELKNILCLSTNDRAIIETNTKGTYAVMPTQASVLYCLLLDASVLDTSFTHWADDFGYDQDSLKALNVYNACCDNAKLFNSIFSREQQKRLSELLEDY